ncbi:MAG: hypothetical protein LBM94_04240 [Propionibacteriaceae bacterium]|jgi:hypothetical protein|nr:hypothetical protein [Propionibacteriaceae bacterium]
METELAQLGVDLALLAAKGTATAVYTRIRALFGEKDVSKIRGTYDEIINELLEENAQAIYLAQAYRFEVDRIEISDSDIEHLQNTLHQVLEISRAAGASVPESIDSFKKLLSVDTLRAMQVLGFNYKAAIGDPLTKVCADLILRFSGETKQARPPKTGR